MSVLQQSDILTAWAAKAQEAANQHPAVNFDARTALPAWLVETARDQAERVFLILDGTPVERRDLGWAEHFIQASGMAFLTAWQGIVDAYRSGAEPWSKDAASAAAKAYNDRLDELAPGIHAGGRA